jgi:hypothetical protein
MVTLEHTTRRKEFVRPTAEQLIREAEKNIEPGVVSRWARRAGFMDEILEPVPVAPAA